VNGRLLQRITPASLPQAPIGAQQVGVLMAELLEVNRADLLLALDQEVDSDRQCAFSCQPGLDRLDSQHQVAFVVGHTAGVELAITRRWIEGR
jgi:hypothetical protein